jgi:Cu/Ag efflux protein CusF
MGGSRRRGAASLLLVAALACRRPPTHVGVGDVVALDADGRRVTISHEEIAGLMPAMTMAFPVRSPDLLAGVTIGTRVRFELTSEPGGLIVTALTPIGPATGGRPGVHDHTPHHGGVVTMVGMRHLEAVATRDGRVKVYLTDVWRRPLPLDGSSGTVVVDLPDGPRTLALHATADALEASGSPLTGADVRAAVRVAREGESLEANFLLPLSATTAGAAGLPVAGCVAPEPRPPRARCALSFAAPVTALDAHGSGILLGVAGTGVTEWRIPSAEFVLAFEPQPAIVAGPDTVPHADAPAAIAVSPDGREAAVAIENRLLVHALASGRLLRVLPPLHDIVRDLAWGPAGLLVAVFYDRAAHLLDPADGREITGIEVEREASAVAFSADGRLAAVGSEVGGVTVAELPNGPRRVLAGFRGPASSLAFAGTRILSTAGDGSVRVWDAGTGAALAQAAAAPGLLRLAVSPAGTLVASAGLDHVVRIHEIASGRLVEALVWHEAAVWGLGWVGSVLVSGDGAGAVMLWELGDLAPAP